MINNPTKFYIVRHGQTDWNVGRKIQGHSDIPINEVGEKEAEALAQELKDIHFDKVFSSDLLRAKRTAEIIALERKLAVQATEALREGNMGKFEGTNFDDFFPLFNEWQKLTEEEQKKHPKISDYETIEKQEMVGSRLITFLREVAIASRGQTILVVSHAGVIANFLKHLGYRNPKGKDYISVGNTAYMHIDSDGVEFEVVELKGIEADAK